MCKSYNKNQIKNGVLDNRKNITDKKIELITDIMIGCACNYVCHIYKLM